MPDFSSASPTASCIANTITFPSSAAAWDGAPIDIVDYFAVRFAGYILIRSSGVYTFYLNSDDGSKLYIGSKLLIDNDYGQLLYQMFYQSLLHCHCDMRDEAAIKDEYFASFMAGGMLSITKTYVTKEKREQSFIEKITYELFSGTFFK
jgi:hypothetical protein